ncbi:MAG TPA: hypothetical protein VME44_28380 [Streptosporangiaceae bacterium]|nr:hypothetical protein [Streptosporangiaceae bacterium]
MTGHPAVTRGESAMKDGPYLRRGTPGRSPAAWPATVGCSGRTDLTSYAGGPPNMPMAALARKIPLIKR